MNTPITQDHNSQTELQSLKTITMVVYALQAVGLLLVITFVIAVMINYIKRDDVRESWLESHFRWQMRTFWFGLLWFLLGVLTYIFIIGWIILAVDAIWVIYRILKGWLNLYDNKPMSD